MTAEKSSLSECTTLALFWTSKYMFGQVNSGCLLVLEQVQNFGRCLDPEENIGKYTP